MAEGQEKKEGGRRVVHSRSLRTFLFCLFPSLSLLVPYESTCMWKWILTDRLLVELPVASVEY